MKAWCVLILCAWLAPLAGAQFGPKAPLQVVRVDWGFDKSLHSERFCPVTVWVLGDDKPFSGEISLEYRQDPTQPARVFTPLSTTPGKTVGVELLCAMPWNCHEVVLSITGEGWRGRMQFGPPGNALALPLPSVLAPSLTILNVGETSASGLARLGGGVNVAPQAPPNGVVTPGFIMDRVWAQSVVAETAADKLPLNWLAYDACDVVVVRSASLVGMEPRRLAALRDWLRAGGRAVVIADTDARGWRMLLADDGTDDPIELGDIGAAVINAPGAKPGESSPLPRADGRVIALTRRGEDEGWRLAPSATGHDGRVGGLAATGPVGMGMLCVAGADPTGLEAGGTSGAEIAGWRTVIEALVPPRAIDSVNSSYAGYTGPYADEPVRLAMESCFDSVGFGAPPEGVAFLMTAGIIALLALLLGPFDALVLKKLRQRHRSWMTALLWIALACAAAYLMPWTLRRSDTVLARLTAADVCPAGDAASGWRTGLTGVFSGRPEQLRLTGTEGAVWRGVSPMQSWGETRMAFAALPLAQGQRPGGRRESAPGPLGMGQWMMRCMMDDSPESGEEPALALRVRHESAWSVRVTELPGHCRVRACALRTSEGWSTIEAAGDATEGWSGRAVSEPTRECPARWARTASWYSPWGATTTAIPDANFAAVLSMPGASRREAAIGARVSTGRWACVYLELDDVAPDVGAEGVKPTARCVLRRLVRLERPDWTRPGPAGLPASAAPPATGGMR